jgi:hypothetical protein
VNEEFPVHYDTNRALSTEELLNLADSLLKELARDRDEMYAFRLKLPESSRWTFHGIAADSYSTALSMQHALKELRRRISGDCPRPLPDFISDYGDALGTPETEARLREEYP